MIRKKLIIFLSEDLELIKSNNLSPTDTDLIFMSPFLKLANKHNDFRKFYFDDLITESSKEKNFRLVEKLMWNWFRDTKGKDITVIDGLSIGESFISTVHMLINKSLKIYEGLNLILQKDDKVFYNSELIYFIKIILFEVCNKKKINHQEIRVRNKYIKKTNYLDILLSIELRDHKWLKTYSSSTVALLANTLIYLQKYKLNSGKLKILTTGSEKLNKNTKEDTNRKIIEIRPISKIKDLRLLFDKDYFIFILKKNKRNNGNIFKSLNQSINKNLSLKYKLSFIGMIQNILESEVLFYAEDLYNHYIAYKSLLKKLRPNTVLVTGETHELYQSITRAAKAINIKTILTSHGYSDIGYKEFKTGNSQIFDGALAYGDDQYKNYIAQGFRENQVIKSIFPYFKKFVPKKINNKKEDYRKALVLFPELNNLCSGYNFNSIDEYFHNVISVLEKLNINIVGFKSRFSRHDEIKNRNGYLEINEKEYSHFYGYSNLLEYIQDIDLVVGPLCSAIYEVFLEGKDFYPFEHDDISKYTPHHRNSIDNFIHISRNKYDLFNNIKDRKLFKKNYSIDNLTFLKNINTEYLVYQKYDESILKINSNFHEK